MSRAENPRSLEAESITETPGGSYARASNASWEDFTGRGDPEQRFQLRRLCPCEACDGTGKTTEPGDRYETRGPDGRLVFATQHNDRLVRCPECHGEGRTLELVATAGSPEAVGVALVQLGREGEWTDCPFGLLEEGADGKRHWLLLPWRESPRNASDAGKLLQRRRRLTK